MTSSLTGSAPAGIRIRRICLFLLLAMGLHVLGRLTGNWLLESYSPLGVVFVFVLIDGKPVLRSLGLSLRISRWLLAAWLTPLGVALLAHGPALLLPGVTFSYGMETIAALPGAVSTPGESEAFRQGLMAYNDWRSFLGLVAYALSIATAKWTLLSIGEEIAFRGFLQAELSPLGFWKASMLVGVSWGLWTAPTFLFGPASYVEVPYTGALAYVAFTVLFSPILAYVRLRAGSVWAACIMRGSLFATGPFALMYLKGGDGLTVGMYGLSGLIVVAVADVWLWRRMKREPYLRV